MKIVNWNLFVDNKNPIEAIDKILEMDPDVITFQEITDRGLKYLKKLGFTNHYHVSIEGEKKTYNAISTKLDIADKYVVDYWTTENPSLFEVVSRGFLPSGTKQKTAVGALLVDQHGKEYKIFNFHLTWAASPRIRMEQFQSIIKNIAYTGEEILVGDFNTFAKPILNFFALIPFGYSISELLLSEDIIFDELFEKLGLQNPFKGFESIPVLPFNLQLDHILIPKKFRIKSQELLESTFGSDHRPQILEIEEEE